MTPVLAAAMPVHSSGENQAEDNWWERTNMDRNNNKIADMVEKYHDHELFLDEANTFHEITILIFPILRGISGTIHSLVKLTTHTCLSVLGWELHEDVSEAGSMEEGSADVYEV